MRQTRLVLLALALLASPLAAMESEPLLPPDDAWDVRLAAGVHDGPPMLFVEVLPEFIWQEGIELRVTLNAWDGTIVEGVAWLDADHRAAFVPFPLPGWEGPAEEREERCQSPTYDVIVLSLRSSSEVTVQCLGLLAELGVHQALPRPSANHTACGFCAFAEFRGDVHYTYAISLHGKCRQRFPRLHSIRSPPLPANSATWTPRNAAPSVMNLTVSISRAFKARTPTEFTDEYHTLIWIWYLVLLGLGPSQSPQRQPPWTLAHPRFRDGALCGLDMSPLPQRSPPFS